MKRTAVAAALLAVVVAAGVLGLRSTAAQTETGDYLPAEVRKKVEQLKADFAREPTNGGNVEARALVMWDWINAYSLTGGPVPAQSLMTITNIAQMLDSGGEGPDGRPTGGARLFTELDTLIQEFRFKDEHPGGLGPLTVNSKGPLQSRSYQTIEFTYVVGDIPMAPGASLMIGRARQMASDLPVVPQFDDQAADNYVTLGCSNSRARFSKTTIPWAGIHGGFRGVSQNMVYRLDEGTLREGDKITIVVGD
ncbi:MAG: hypothetical protein GY953_21955, partial [bacterium]|nr:hypothetical protein [bacterium]